MKCWLNGISSLVPVSVVQVRYHSIAAKPLAKYRVDMPVGPFVFRILALCHYFLIRRDDPGEEDKTGYRSNVFE